MKKNGYTVLEMLLVIVVLGVFTTLILSVTSYAYQDNSVSYYNEVEHLVEKQAVLYAATLTNLEDEKTLVITLNDLVEAGYYIADDSLGNVIDPRNSKSTLNGIKIKLNYNGGNIKASVIEEE